MLLRSLGPLQKAHRILTMPMARYGLGGFLFVASAAVTLWQNAHVAVLWDLSYLLDSSFRLALGQVPYRDFPFAHAPLTFLVQAALIRVAGRVYWHTRVYAALAGATATLLAWRILRGLAATPDGIGYRGELLAALLALPLTVVGIYCIYPYPIYDCDCALAVLFALFLLQRAGSATPLRCLLTGAALVPPLFFKQNIGLFFLASALAAVLALGLTGPSRGASVRRAFWTVLGAAATLALALLAIHLTAGLHNYFYWTFTFAASRRLPGLRPILGIYHQTSLLWTVPAALAALWLLHRAGPGSRGWRRPVALLLLAAPFLSVLAQLPFTDDPSDRADQLLALWPHLLLLGAMLALWKLRRRPNFASLLPFVLLATIHGTFLSQQLWGSTYSLWPLLMLLLACLLTQVAAVAVRGVALPLTAIAALTLLLCGGLYSFSHERLSYTQLSGAPAHATLPALRGLTTPGPWIPAFEELIADTNRTIPREDTLLLLPGQDPFYYATGRTPRFPVLLLDPATNPYSPREFAEQAIAHNVRWLIVNCRLQLDQFPEPDYPEFLTALGPLFVLDHSLSNYDVYRRR
jgi:hypothetical protein